MVKRIGILYFSPTNTTKKICEAVALGLGTRHPQTLDMTFPDTRTRIITDPNAVTADIDHLVVGAPVHSGKLPIQVIECLSSIAGNGKQCSAIVVYGNREYGIALYRMVKILHTNGFKVSAAAAFIGQHSYSDIVPVAIGRPDESDIEKARRFGADSLNASGNLSLKDVPMQLDKTSKSDKYSALKPVHIEKLCIQCGQCAENCPGGLLSPDTGMYLSRAAKNQCIGCMACVKTCMEKARVAKANPIVKVVMNNILRQASKERKEPLTIVA
ncbi:MAG: 4Fe-4S binding protein [Desulfobacula sp.]|uniref:4Fe-4S dicluster domain-containing protein n=1 Tax=Desulfobacula sp. TaxID=2593537 RepID=UPI0025BB75CD|nr:4Fe-4S dicluster domain-containing protein [Desulfobacula sp.]MCD4723091.1 4Fe-4S binding protein [Desulfobacula sp.]